MTIFPSSPHTHFFFPFYFLHFTFYYRWEPKRRERDAHSIATCSRTFKKKKKKKKKTLCRNLHTPVKRKQYVHPASFLGLLSFREGLGTRLCVHRGHAESRGGHAHKQAWLNRPSTLSANSAIQDRCFCFLPQKKKKKRSTANQQLKLQKLLELIYSHVYDNLSNLLCR